MRKNDRKGPGIEISATSGELASAVGATEAGDVVPRATGAKHQTIDSVATRVARSLGKDFAKGVADGSAKRSEQAFKISSPTRNRA
jgi:hypothetical protein